jgi:hypothetical protein
LLTTALPAPDEVIAARVYAMAEGGHVVATGGVG